MQCRFCWHAQYLRTLKGDSCCCAHCTGPFHVLRLSNMNVVVPLLFASHRLLCTMYWTLMCRGVVLCMAGTTSQHLLPHQITSHHWSRHHISTSHHTSPPRDSYITTTDTPRKHNQPAQKRQHQTERPEGCSHKNLGFGIALVNRPARIL